MEVQVKVSIPDDVLNTENGDTSRRILEQFALAGYQSGQLTAAQVRRILGFSTRLEVDAFLKAHQVELEYSAEDLERDAAASREISNGHGNR
jgi:predicted HTH domain antitoxin